MIDATVAAIVKDVAGPAPRVQASSTGTHPANDAQVASWTHAINNVLLQPPLQALALDVHNGKDKGRVRISGQTSHSRNLLEPANFPIVFNGPMGTLELHQAQCTPGSMTYAVGLTGWRNTEQLGGANNPAHVAGQVLASISHAAEEGCRHFGKKLTNAGQPVGAVNSTVRFFVQYGQGHLTVSGTAAGADPQFTYWRKGCEQPVTFPLSELLNRDSAFKSIILSAFAAADGTIIPRAELYKLLVDTPQRNPVYPCAPQRTLIAYVNLASRESLCRFLIGALAMPQNTAGRITVLDAAGSTTLTASLTKGLSLPGRVSLQDIKPFSSGQTAASSSNGGNNNLQPATVVHAYSSTHYNPPTSSRPAPPAAQQLLQEARAAFSVHSFHDEQLCQPLGWVKTEAASAAGAGGNMLDELLEAYLPSQGGAAVPGPAAPHPLAAAMASIYHNAVEDEDLDEDMLGGDGAAGGSGVTGSAAGGGGAMGNSEAAALPGGAGSSAGTSNALVCNMQLNGMFEAAMVVEDLTTLLADADHAQAAANSAHAEAASSLNAAQQNVEAATQSLQRANPSELASRLAHARKQLSDAKQYLDMVNGCMQTLAGIQQRIASNTTCSEEETAAAATRVHNMLQEVQNMYHAATATAAGVAEGLKQPGEGDSPGPVHASKKGKVGDGSTGGSRPSDR